MTTTMHIDTEDAEIITAALLFIRERYDAAGIDAAPSAYRAARHQRIENLHAGFALMANTQHERIRLVHGRVGA